MKATKSLSYSGSCFVSLQEESMELFRNGNNTGFDPKKRERLVERKKKKG